MIDDLRDWISDQMKKRKKSFNKNSCKIDIRVFIIAINSNHISLTYYFI